MAIAICKIILQQQWIRGLLHHVYGELVLTRTCKMDLANHQRDLIFHDLSFGGSCASMVFVAATLLVLVTSLNHWLSGSQLLSALRHRHGLVTKLRPSSPTSRQSMPPLLVSGDDDDDEALTARCSLESEVRLHRASSSPHDRPRRAGRPAPSARRHSSGLSRGDSLCWLAVYAHASASPQDPSSSVVCTTDDDRRTTHRPVVGWNITVYGAASARPGPAHAKPKSSPEKIDTGGGGGEPTSEGALQGVEPGQGGVVAGLAPRPVEHAVDLVEAQDALPEVVTPLQRPERPVEVEVGGDGGDAAVVPVVVDVAAAVVDAELAEEHRPPLVEQVQRAARHARRHPRAHLVGVPRPPRLPVGEAVPVHLERHLPGEADVHLPRVEERQVVVEAHAGQDHHHARVRRVHRLRPALHVPACTHAIFFPRSRQLSAQPLHRWRHFLFLFFADGASTQYTEMNDANCNCIRLLPLLFFTCLCRDEQWRTRSVSSAANHH
ncbi:Os04g0481050 [Oryza sativa Japonica Group]|uniref:Os04g0481050 protein n=2 Tax=Oryza sativa subsp. japonica TaxID=39947 RepID=A0A0P0WBM2_ORYSJ|nr:hypothetical protein EE612_024009 [Oryza sativa]BAH92718.1 Os04g0481050 [Oryza sativa Japonica Group]BAS89741.1 Os04g0481050 [Oryza sativa Japonica Group]|eukprot:NP_001173990.1 Os04g0481050 [Oryza sativa Japonica Group]